MTQFKASVPPETKVSERGEDKVSTPLTKLTIVCLV